jgi:hypothetical protein
MVEKSILPGELTAEVTGIYLNEYQRIVKPNRRFLIPTYFVQRWVSRLGPTLAWIVVSLQQACWRADDDHCAVAQTTIAEEIGIHRHTVSKELQENPFRAWFIPSIESQPGIINPQDNTYQPLPSRYTIYLSTPLIPEHLAGLYHYFRQECGTDPLAEVEQAVNNLLSLKSKGAWAYLETQADQVERQFESPMSVAEIFVQATQLDLQTIPASVADKLKQKLAGLETHLTETGHVNCRQYFRLNWAPVLGPAMAWLIMILRSQGYYNPETDELRDICQWKKKDIAQMLGQSNQNLRRLLTHQYAGHFFQIVDNQKHKITLRVALAQEPLTTESAADFWRRQPISGNGRKNATNFDMTPPRNATNFDMTPPRNATNFDITPAGTQQISTSPPQNPTNFDTYKYFRDSVLIVDNDREDIDNENTPSDTISDSNDKVRKLLAGAGLSDPGLSNLCNRIPPLNPQRVKATLLYAEAHNLKPGYIYRHLENDDTPVADLFWKFAALDDEMLDLFRVVTADLKRGDLPLSGDRFLIPEQLIPLLTEFARIFAGVEPSIVRALLDHSLSEAERGDSQIPVTDLPPLSSGQSSSEDDLASLWRQLLDQLRLQMTRSTFEAWLKETELVGREGSHFTVVVRNDFAREWLENRLYNTIRRTLANLIKDEDVSELPPVKINFIVAGG